MEENYKEVIEIGLALIEEKLMEKFGLTASDVKDIMEVYYDDIEWRKLLEDIKEGRQK